MKFLLASFTASVLLTALLIHLAGLFGWNVPPRPDRWGQRTVAKFGGIPILLALLGGVAFFSLDRRLLAIVGLTVLMGLLGFLDDLFRLSATPKLVVQFVFSAGAVAMGVSYPLTQNPHVNALCTVAWLVGITNAFNIIDNIDGLAGGVAVIALAKLVFLPSAGSGATFLMLSMAGALLGFLVFNFYPAKVFMGDTGSLAVGFFLGCSSVLLTEHLSSLFSIVAIPALVLFLPVFDAALVSATRRLSGRPLAVGAKDHSSHRLVLLGMSERQAVLLLYLISAVAGGVAALWKSQWHNLGAGLVALYLVMAAMFWLYLARIEMPSSWLSERRSVAWAVPGFLSRTAGRVGVLILDAAMLMLSMYFSFLFRFETFSRHLTGVLLFTGALSILVRLPLLSLFSGSRLDWRIRSRRDVYPILATSVAGGLMLACISYYLLPVSKEIPLALLSVDGIFSAALLLVGRFSQTVFDDFLSEGAGDFHSVMTDSGREFFHHYMDWKQHHGDMIAIGSQNGLASDFLFGIPIEGTADLSRLIARRTITTVYLLPDCSPAAGEQIAAVCGAHGVSVSALRYSFEAIAAPSADSRKLDDALRQSAIAD